MKRDFTDYHCHLLPAQDDGATDPQESVAMARILAGFGFARVYCTPHRIKGCFENDPERVRQTTAALQRILDDEGVDLQLIPGTEHYLDEFLIDQVPGALTVDSRYLLVEVPFRSGGEMIPAMVEGLKKRGLNPLFAHPERCRAFEPILRSGGLRGAFSFLSRGQKEPEIDAESMVFKLRDAGCRFQGNLGSFAGFYGSEIKQRALLFLKHGIYCCLGSDAHRSDDLALTLAAGYDVIAAEIGKAETVKLLQGAML